jgi:hypothetical protein
MAKYKPHKRVLNRGFSFLPPARILKRWAQIALTLKSSHRGWTVRVEIRTLTFSLTTSGMDLEPTRFLSAHTDFIPGAEVTGVLNQLLVSG